MIRLRFFLIWILIAALAACNYAAPTSAPGIDPPSVPSQPDPTQSPALAGNADIIFINAIVVTMDDANPSAEAIAVQGNKIIAVGTNEEVLNHRGTNTILVSLEGKTLVPGFIDSHQHRILNAIEGKSDVDENIDNAVSQGWTTLNELYVIPDFMPMYETLDRQGKFRLRVNIYPAFNTSWGAPLEEWYATYQPGQAIGPHLRIAGLKVFTDVNNATTLIWGQDGLNATLLKLYKGGWPLAIKSVSTRSLEMILIAVESVYQLDPNVVSHRIRIEHALFMTPDQISRIRKFGMIPSIQTNMPGELIGGTDLEALLPYESQGSAFPWRSLAESNVRFASGSAWPTYYVDEPTGAPFGSPIRLIYQAVTRAGNLGVQPEAWMLDQTLSAEQTMRALTIDAAYATFQDDILGSLTNGKFADMVILSDNPLGVSTPDINNIRVLMTMIDGKVEYCAAGFESLCPSSPLSPLQPDSAPITASSSLSDSPPSNAIDGNSESIWNSGADPAQWIQLDLGKPTAIRAIRLVISQYPEGQTVHQIWGGADANNLTLLREFKGFTSDPGVLEFQPSTALTNIRYLKIVTTQSPSWVAWREIEVVEP